MRQEKLETTRNVRVIQHKPTRSYFLNTWSIHSYDAIRSCLPQNLRNTPIRVVNVLEMRKTAVSQLRDKRAARSAPVLPTSATRAGSPAPASTTTTPVFAFDTTVKKSKPKGKGKGSSAATKRSTAAACTNSFPSSAAPLAVSPAQLDAPMPSMQIARPPYQYPQASAFIGPSQPLHSPPDYASVTNTMPTQPLPGAMVHPINFASAGHTHAAAPMPSHQWSYESDSYHTSFQASRGPALYSTQFMPAGHLHHDTTMQRYPPQAPGNIPPHSYLPLDYSPVLPQHYPSRSR